MKEPRPLSLTSMPQVHLPRSPLARVIAQVRFPQILAIRDPDKVAALQEPLRPTYPILSQDQIHRIDLSGGESPSIQQGLIWRLADREKDVQWRVSLGVDFVALETSAYRSREDFLSRLGTVVAMVEKAFNPASASRLGLRYIDRLSDEAFDCVTDLIRPEVLGLAQPPGDLPPALGESTLHLMTEAQFLAQDGARIQGRWGQLPKNATYDADALEPVAKPSWILDLDMFTGESLPFADEPLLTTARRFAECLYALFRQMVTDEFLRFHGGEI